MRLPHIAKDDLVKVAVSGVPRASRYASGNHTFSIGDRSGEQAGQGTDGKRCMYGRTTAPTPQRIRAGYSVCRHCVLLGYGSKSNTITNRDTACRTSVAMHNEMIQQVLTTVSPNSNTNIEILQSEAGFVSKCSVIPNRFPCPPFIASLVFETQVAYCQRKAK
ncbi:hypothetical protein TNCV_3670341 [Trichonephila clavipes]|nr:hypothetical protein TNCV_3670341 [Trichonephila clavipes]